jgi:hypothetical protein
MMKSKIRWLITACALALSLPACADGLLALVNPAERAMSSVNLDMAFSAQSFMATDYTSVRHFTDDWRGSYTPREGKNLAVSFMRADVSAQYESWSVGYFYRQEILLESNKDTTDIAHANKTKTPVQAGRTYVINLALNGFETQGVRLDKAFAWKMGNTLDVTFGIGTSLMNGQRARFGQAQGNALSTATGYTYNLNMTDSNSQMTYPFMPSGEVSGTGYAFDLGLRLLWQDGKRLDIAINDLAGEIRWQNLPETTMNASSASSTYDSQGYIVLNPAVSGQNKRVEKTQKLDTKGGIQFHSPLAYGIAANFGMEWINDNIFPRYGLSYVATSGIGVMADYDYRFKTFGLGATWKYMYLSARTQNMYLDRSRGYGVGAGLALTF